MKGTNLLLVFGFLAICGLAMFLNRPPASPPVPPPNPGSVGPGQPGAAEPEPAGGTAPSAPSTSATPAGPTLTLLFSTSDGKKDWIEKVTADYNKKGVKVAGKTVVVKLNHMRSGESMQKILAGTERPHLWSPVSRSWIDVLNETWQTRHNQNFIDEARPTVRTALVLALWEPMARALGYPDKPIGWEEVLKVALDPEGWASYGHSEWGRFKFGHSHPDFSTSAMLSLVSLLYAQTGKRSGLTAEDLKDPKVVAAITALERAIVHYGESSSWLTEKLCTRGPGYLSAVTLYESSVVKANLKFPKKAFPLVAIYPKEGTFWENHPAGLVNAAWVGEEQRAAARLYLEFLLAPAQQALTAEAGFRPADPAAPIAAPIDREHGADPAASDANALAPVSEDIFKRAQALWHQVKKKSTLYLLIDTSGSMNGEPMNAARRGAEAFLKRMEPDDEVQVIAFGTRVTPLGRLGPMREVGEELVNKVRGLFAQGQTALYDAVGLALTEVERARAASKGGRLYGIVVLSDGKDTSSQTQQLDLLARLPKGEDAEGTRVFTIAYGPEADFDLLKKIADQSNAVTMKGEEANIEKVYLSISSYF
ncbi:MAG: VWA domain-containing protein [Planctomycetes bacterium]|nr:VWA domain-containing protein [Planctomycetota bacterium]